MFVAMTATADKASSMKIDNEGMILTVLDDGNGNRDTL